MLGVMREYYQYHGTRDLPTLKERMAVPQDLLDMHTTIGSHIHHPTFTKNRLQWYVWRQYQGSKLTGLYGFQTFALY